MSMSIIYISKSKWQRNIVQRCATKCCLIIQNKPSKQKFKFLQDVEGLNCTSLVQGDKPLLVARIAGRMYVDGFLLFDPFLISCTVQTTKEGTGESLEVTLVIGGLSSRHFGQQHCYSVNPVHLVHLVGPWSTLSTWSINWFSLTRWGLMTITTVGYDLNPTTLLGQYSSRFSHP